MLTEALSSWSVSGLAHEVEAETFVGVLRQLCLSIKFFDLSRTVECVRSLQDIALHWQQAVSKLQEQPDVPTCLAAFQLRHSLPKPESEKCMTDFVFLVRKFLDGPFQKASKLSHALLDSVNNVVETLALWERGHALREFAWAQTMTIDKLSKVTFMAENEMLEELVSVEKEGFLSLLVELAVNLKSSPRAQGGVHYELDFTNMSFTPDDSDALASGEVTTLEVERLFVVFASGELSKPMGDAWLVP